MNLKDEVKAEEAKFKALPKRSRTWIIVGIAIAFIAALILLSTCTPASAASPVQLVNPLPQNEYGQPVRQTYIVPVDHSGIYDGIFDNTFTGTVAAPGTLVTMDTSTYGYLEFQLPTVCTTPTIVVESSNDGTPGTGSTFVTSLFWAYNAASIIPAVSATPAATALYVAPVTGTTMRVRASACASGSMTLFGQLKRGSLPYPPAMVVSGSVASAVADSGNPNKIGCKILVPVAAFTANNRQDVGCSVDGGVFVEEAGRSFTNITTATTTTAKSGIGNFRRLIINTAQAGATATIYDSLTASGTKIGTFDLSTARTIDVDAKFLLGLTVLTAGATPADITAIWR